MPFCRNSVYITTDTLSVIELRDRIAHGVIKNVTPVNMYALSLFDDPTKPQKLSVRVENQLNIPLKGTLHLKVAGASDETSAPFSIEASKLAEVAVPWPTGITPSENNQYAITVSAETTMAGDSATPTLPVTVSRQQVASVARFVKKTVAMTGSVDDWKGITPVLLDSSQLTQEVDLSQYVLHPELEKPSTDPNAQKIVARIYTAYDKNNVYVSAAVTEDSFGNKAGDQKVRGRGHPSNPNYKSAPVPYLQGTPDGLGLPTDGDCLQLSFGFRDRVPGYGHPMDDPYAWKGDFFDADYSYMANPSTQGDTLTRVWGPNTQRQDAYQTAEVPGVGIIAQSPVYHREGEASAATTTAAGAQSGPKPPMPSMKEMLPNAKIKITRYEANKLTLYEMSIPRTELKLFDPEKGRCRFSFLLYPGGRNKFTSGLNWGDFAGVFDYWKDSGSFIPVYMTTTPCETFFGIEK